MKNLKTKLVTVLSVVGLITGSLFFNSCSDESNVETEQNFQDELGSFKKELTIFDETKENSVVILLGSNDQSVLKMWTANNFDLKFIDKNESLGSVYKMDAEVASRNDFNDDSEEIATEVYYTIVSKNINTSGKRLILEEKPPYSDDLRGWSYSTFYSDEDADPNHTVTVNVYGRNAWKRGYYGVEYKKYSYSGWSTIISEWTRIKNNESKSHSRTPCFKMKARRKYKGTNNSVIIEIEE